MTKGLNEKELKYHDATGLGERSTSTKHILGYVRNSLMAKWGTLLCSPTVARDCKSVMVAETERDLSCECAERRHGQEYMHRGMAAPAASHAWINAEPIQRVKYWSRHMLLY